MSLCLLGTIIGVHGIKGWLKINLFSDIPDRLSKLETVLLGDSEDRCSEIEIEDSKDNDGLVMMKIRQVDDRTEAETFIGKSLFITDEQMLPPPEGRHFVHDLIGCEVIDAESGKSRGKVTDVMLMPANDIYVVEDGQREVLIPAVPVFIKNVDTDNKRILINPVSGLFDEEDED